MKCEVETTCGENMSLQNVLKSVAKRYYARVKKERRALSLKNVIISCVDLTLSSPQKFSHYYLQYLVLGPSYVMTTFFLILGISSNHNFRSFVNKVLRFQEGQIREKSSADLILVFVSGCTVNMLPSKNH